MRLFILLSFLLSLHLGYGQGVDLVIDLEPGTDDSRPAELFPLGDTLYLQMDPSSVGRELYKSDGTAGGTVLVQDINPGPDNSIPRDFFSYQGEIFFNANPGQGVFGVFKTDGTDAGTVPVIPGVTIEVLVPTDSVYYVTVPTSGRSFEKFDGSSLTPVPNATDSAVSVFEAVFYNGKFLLYMSQDGDTVGPELYEYDLTTETYTVIKDIDPGDGSSSISDLTELAGLVFFEAENDLWVTDGTEAGTSMVMTVSSLGISNVRSLFAWQGELYFEGDDGNGDQLIVYNPADSTARNLSGFSGAAANSNHDPTDFVPYNGYLYHIGEDSTDNEQHLFRTAGDVIEQVDGSVFDVDDLVRLNDTLYFEGDDGSTGRELFRFFTPQLLPTVADSLEVCTSEGVTIMASDAPSANWSYTWFADAAGMMPLDTTDTFTSGPLSRDTTFYVRIDSGRVAGDLVAVFVGLNPELADGASINLQGLDTLAASPTGASFSYQWLDSLGNAIAGATEATFAPDTTGDFFVVVTGQSCSDTSDVFAYVDSTTSSIQAFTGGFELFPNPSAGRITLRWEQPTTSAWTLQVSDLMGRRVATARIEAGVQTYSLDLQGQPAGTYLLQLESEQGRISQRILKQ